MNVIELKCVKFKVWSTEKTKVSEGSGPGSRLHLFYSVSQPLMSAHD